MKKFLISAGAAIMILGSLAAGAAGVSKTVTINVAENKPVYAGSVHSAYPSKNLVDGRRKTFVVPESYEGTVSTGYANDWFTVDLLRRYNISKVELYDRLEANETGGRSNFEIQASNDVDFKEYDVLGKMDGLDDTKFPNEGCFAVSAGGKWYRYVRIQATKGADYYGYGEIKVYADEVVTETEIISATASYETEAGGYIYSAQRAIDGLNRNPADAWVAETSDVYHFLQMDLGEEKNIGMIEIEDRYENGNIYAKQGWLIYSSNSVVGSNVLLNQGYLNEYPDYKLLARIGHFGDYNSEIEEFPFPGYPEGMYRAVLDDTEAKQYITLKKDYTPLAGVIGEVRVYKINPQITDTKIDTENKKLYISFNDEMVANNEAFSLTDGKNTVTLQGEWQDTYTYIIDLSECSGDYTLKINKTLTNTKGTGLAEDYTEANITSKQFSLLDMKMVNADNETAKLDITQCSSVKVSAVVRNNAAYGKKARLGFAQYDTDGKLKKLGYCQEEIPAGETESFSFTKEISVSEGDMVKAFLWDENLSPFGVLESERACFTEIYVSPDGDDTNKGSKLSPVATLARAQELVRERNDNMTSDINVHIGSGVYTQPQTLAFTDEDSGTNGYYVNYKGEPGAVISGGIKIDKFDKISDGVYCAEIDLDMIRELYVNGKKAVRAQSENRIKPISVYEEDGVRKGFVISSKDIGNYKNPEDIQLHYARSWCSLVLNAESIIDNGDTKTLIMSQPEFEYASAPLGAGYTFWVDETNGFYLENTYELMDSENEFYYDRKAKKLYYRTDSAVMETAEVYVPVLEQIMTVKGRNLNNKAKNISFSGLEFAHATYKKPDEGYIGDQAQRYEIFETKSTAYPLDNGIAGGNIRVLAAENISFKNNIFHGMGAVALGLYDGAADCEISGNVFYDINDSAITVGLPSDAYMQEVSEKGNEIALFKPSKASGNVESYDCAYGNDGDTTTGWTIAKPTGATNLDAYWQVDLLKEYKIDLVKILPRSGYDQPPTRKNFEILGSNDEDFSEGSYTQLAVWGDIAFSNETGYEAEVTDEGRYRYIRIRKTKDEYFFLSDVEIYTYDEEFIPVKEVCKDNVIKNNYITDIGLYNTGAPGIQSYYTDSLEISNNTIRNVPYSGIAAGWGWNYAKASVTCRNNKICNNYIDTFNGVNFDGGGIYTLGQQPGTVISGNYIKNQVNGHAAIYPDSGSSYLTITGNVLENVDIPFFTYNSANSGRSNNTITGNFANTSSTAYLAADADSVAEPQEYFLTGFEPQKVAEIKNNAGLGAGYEYLLDVPYKKQAPSFERTYGNIIDENKWNIGATQDPKMLEYYLEYLIEYAEEAYTYALENALIGEEKLNAFKTAIDEAKSAYALAEGQITKPTYTDKIYYGGMTMDRAAAIQARADLKEAIEVFLSNN